MTIFGLKMMVKSGIEKIILKFHGQFSLSGQIFLHWAAATLKAIVEFQNNFFYTTFYHHFYAKNGVKFR